MKIVDMGKIKKEDPTKNDTIKMKIIERKIAELKPAEYNPRTLSDKQFKDIKASLKKFGFIDPVIVNTHEDRRDVIIGGHQRLKVWAEMGNDTAPTVEVCLPFKREQELNVRLNKNTGSWDFDILANLFETTDLLEWGFESFELGMGEDEKKETKDKSDEIEVGYKIEISCVNEEQQENIYNELVERGIICRILTL